MPQRTAVPSVRRISAPAPLLITSGTTPRMNANEVITMGRNRSRLASTTGVPKQSPFSQTTSPALTPTRMSIGTGARRESRINYEIDKTVETKRAATGEDGGEVGVAMAVAVTHAAAEQHHRPVQQ